MGEANCTILFVDERKEQFLLFRRFFERLESIKFIEVCSFKAALNQLKEVSPSLIISNISLGNHDGLELLQELKQMDDEAYFILFSSEQDDHLEATALEQGADDFIHAGVSVNVLQRKMLNVLKRIRHTVKTDVVNLDGLRIDRDRYIVEKSGRKIILPKKEFELLYVLASRPDKVFRREELTKLIWGKVEDPKKSRTIDVHIRKLRTKIGEDYIKTVKGVGYRF